MLVHIPTSALYKTPLQGQGCLYLPQAQAAQYSSLELQLQQQHQQINRIAFELGAPPLYWIKRELLGGEELASRLLLGGAPYAPRRDLVKIWPTAKPGTSA